MGKVSIIVMLFFSVVIATPMVHGAAQPPKAVEEYWYQNLGKEKEKLTKLHFYYHDTVSGKNPTVVTVAKADTTLTSPTLFGLMNMTDDSLTVEPEPNPTVVGRAKGLYVSAGLDQLGLFMTFTFVFTTEKYNGSTLSVLGWNPVLDTYREMSIIGGSGVFRRARGTATCKTTWLNLTTGDAVIEYNVVALHY